MVFVTAYLVGVIVVLAIWGIIAFKKQIDRGEIDGK